MHTRTSALIVTLSLLLFWAACAAADRGIVRRPGASTQSALAAGGFHALIIGIDEYRDPGIPDLRTAVKDARALADVLSGKYAFETRTLINGQATRAAIFKSLRELAARSGPDDNLLIYYAGHGELDREFDGQGGWWVPADAKAGEPTTYLDNNQVQKAMHQAKARHVLLISDSCYAGTLFGAPTRSLPRDITDRYYRALFNDRSRWGMTSGNKTPVSDHGSGGHSVFAFQLLKTLCQNDRPYMSTQELYTKIAPIIANNSEQTPMCRPIRNTGDQGGEFVFVRAKDGGAHFSACDPFPLLADSGGFQTVVPPVPQPPQIAAPPIPPDPSDRKPGATWSEPLTGMVFVWAPGGCYAMGSQNGEYDEKPVHEVCVDGFWMARHEVTVKQYLRFAEKNKSHLPQWLEDGGKYNIHTGSDGYYRRLGDALMDPNRPVVGVSWHDAAAYAQWLSAMSGATFRLPSEAEWEYACRGGGRGETYSGGENPAPLAWHKTNSGGKMQPVGAKTPNGLGLYDMSGNVWEWCLDIYADRTYETHGRNNAVHVKNARESADGNSFRVYRGGSWYENSTDCRCAARNRDLPVFRDVNLGFRLLREP